MRKIIESAQYKAYSVYLTGYTALLKPKQY